MKTLFTTLLLILGAALAQDAPYGVFEAHVDYFATSLGGIVVDCPQGIVPPLFINPVCVDTQDIANNEMFPARFDAIIDNFAETSYVAVTDWENTPGVISRVFALAGTDYFLVVSFSQEVFAGLVMVGWMTDVTF